MEWINRLEQSLDYIEKHLTIEIDAKELAQIACCSYYHFQRVFSYMVGVPLAEYTRRRKLSLAAVDLQQGAKVIDVAIKYGYESPTSFHRAFKQMHGINPSRAQQEGNVITSYPRIKFQITVKGAVEMNYRIETKDAFRIIGPSIKLSQELEKNFMEVPQFWEKVAKEGTVDQLLPLNDRKPKGILGVSYFKENNDNSYFIAVASNQEEGIKTFGSYIIPSFTWAIFKGEGSMPHAIQELERRIVTDWLPTSGYEYADGPDIEVYLDNNPANASFEVWLPVRKASE